MLEQGSTEEMQGVAQTARRIALIISTLRESRIAKLIMALNEQAHGCDSTLMSPSTCGVQTAVIIIADAIVTVICVEQKFFMQAIENRLTPSCRDARFCYVWIVFKLALSASADLRSWSNNEYRAYLHTAF